MNARPEKIDFETGELLEDAPDPRSPLQVARSELAAFKFKMIETVAADPCLSMAPCAAAIVVFMSFVSIDKRTLKRTSAYASIITLMARGNMKRTAATTARKLLEQHGYLVPTGSKTKDGCVKYLLENPHIERVKMHVVEAAEYWQEQAAEHRIQERRKKAQKAQQNAVVSAGNTTQTACGASRQHDVVSAGNTNYLRENLGYLGSREEEPIKASSAPSSYGQDGDPHLPYPVPESEGELAAILAEFRQAGFSHAVIGFFRLELIAGRLTPARVEEQMRLAS